jgi:hypothetical protein
VRRGARDLQRRLLSPVPGLVGGALRPLGAGANRRVDRPAGLLDRERRSLNRGEARAEHVSTLAVGVILSWRISGLRVGRRQPLNACHARRHPSRSGLRPAPAARP